VWHDAFDCSMGVAESEDRSDFMADGESVFTGWGARISDDSVAGLAGGAEIAGEMTVAGAAGGAGEGAGEAAGLAAEVAETGFSAPRAGGGDIETLATGFCPAAAVTEFEDPAAEAGETFE